MLSFIKVHPSAAFSRDHIKNELLKKRKRVYLYKNIIELHEQTIQVSSKIYVGSIFGFTLQRKKD